MSRTFLVYEKIDIGLLFRELKEVNTVSDLGLSPNAKCTGEDHIGKLEIEDGNFVYQESGYQKLMGEQ